MAYRSLVEQLAEQKRMARLQGRSPTTSEVRGVSEGYFAANAGSLLKQRELAQTESLAEKNIAASKELQTERLTAESKLQTDLQTQRLETEKQLAAEQLAAEKEAAAAAQKAQDRQTVLGSTAAGAAIGFSVGGPPGAAVGGGIGFVAGLVSSCIVYRYFYGTYSRHVAVARAFCGKHMDLKSYLAYTAFGERLIARMNAIPILRWPIRVFLADPFYEYMRYKLGRNKKATWFQKLIGRSLHNKFKRDGKQMAQPKTIPPEYVGCAINAMKG